MNFQFVTVSETGASELLPLQPDTIRVFLVLRELRMPGKPEPWTDSSTLPAPWLAVRRFGGYAPPFRG